MEEESKMLGRLQYGHPIDDLSPVVSAADWVACQDAVRDIHVDDKVKRYLLEIVHGTRMHDDIQLGGSPRASIALFRTAQAMAAVQGRSFVIPDDVKKMVQAVMAHRVILRPESRLRKVTTAALLHEIVSDVRVPMVGRGEEKDHFDD
jgi:MoxR-like ATPase